MSVSFCCVVGGFRRKPLSKIFQPSRGEVCTSPILGPLASFCSLVENPTVIRKMYIFILNSFQIIYRYIQINKNDTRVLFRTNYGFFRMILIFYFENKNIMLFFFK